MTTTAPGNYLDLNGARLVSCRVTIGAAGPWIADVMTADDSAIVGTSTAAGAVGVTLRIGDLVLVGAVMRDQAFAGTRGLLLVGGAGGWGKTVPPQAYHNPAGIPLALPLGDVAAVAGETIDPAELAAGALLGPDFVREGAPASRVLEQLVGPAWWVAADGVTHVQPRPQSTIESPFLVEHYDGATGRLLASTEAIADWTPGAVVGAPWLPAARVLSSVTIDARPDGALRVEALTAPVAAPGPAAPGDRVRDLLRALIRAELSDLTFRALWEYAVARAYADDAGTPVIDALPVANAEILPPIVACPIRPAIGGAVVELVEGARVVVGFINADPKRPAVLLHDATIPKSVTFLAAESAGISAPLLNVGAGGFKPVALAEELLAWSAALTLAVPDAPAMPPTIAATKLKAS